MWGRKPVSQSSWFHLSSFEQQIRAATVLDAAILSEQNLAKPFSEESWKITLTLVETTKRVAWHPWFTKNCNLATEYFPNAEGLR
jgi:hypothetical protein